ncbi:hypothetical protein BKA01_005927 [Pseudonocardia eucalypti]|nr:hypothetical protein [Pseudonocardia eucalypti]
MTRASEDRWPIANTPRPPRPGPPGPARPDQGGSNGEPNRPDGKKPPSPGAPPAPRPDPGPAVRPDPSKSAGRPDHGPAVRPDPTKARPESGPPAVRPDPSKPQPSKPRPEPSKPQSSKPSPSPRPEPSGGSSSPAPSSGAPGGSVARGNAPTAPPRGRPPLPGPPPGSGAPRLPGPPMMAGPPPRYTPPRPRRELTAAQRSKLTMLAVVLMAVGAVVGFLAAAVIPTQYAARTTIQYNIAAENSGDFLKTDRNLTTQTVLITSRNVLQPVADANGISVDDLTKKVVATVLQSSNIIQVEVKDPSRDMGITLANAVAKQYLTVANNSGPKGYLQNQLNQVKQLQAAPRPGTTPADAAALAARVTTLQSQLDELNLTANQSTVLAPAYSVTDPVTPGKGAAGITGGICGLLIGLMTVATLSRRWTRS